MLKFSGKRLEELEIFDILKIKATNSEFIYLSGYIPGI